MKVLTSASEKLFSPLHIEPTDRLHLRVDGTGKHFVAKICSTRKLSYGDGFASASTVARLTFTQRVPEKKELVKGGDGSEWQFAATDVTAALVSKLWPKDQVIFADDEAKIVFEYLVTTGFTLDRNAEVVAAFRERGELPAGTDYPHNDGLELIPYQKVGTYNLVHSEGYGLFMEPGTGKTCTTIGAVDAESPPVRQKAKRTYRMLVVCPRAVRKNWETEVDRFSVRKHNTVILRGGQVSRIKTLIDALTAKNNDFTCIVVSYETMTRMIDTLCAIEWDRIVLDESHSIKWPTTLRSKMSMKLREAGRRRCILTGTPIANSILDLYSQLEFLGEGRSGFQSWKAFRAFYGVWEKTQHGDKMVGLQNLPFMKERLARMSYHVTKKEALPDLPEKVNDVLEVTMIPEQRATYDRVRGALAAEAERDLRDAEEGGSNMQITVNNVLTKMLRLAQITSGYAAVDAQFSDDGIEISPPVSKRFDTNPKIEALVEELKQRPKTSKTIVWTCWVDNIKQLSARLVTEGINAVTIYGATKDREAAEKAFNDDPSVTVCIANPAVAGAGLNLLGYDWWNGADAKLDTNADWTVYMSSDWSSIKRGQSGERNNRKGTRVQVRETDIVVAGTIDEQIRCRVVAKQMAAMQAQDVRAILHAVLTGEINDE